MGITPQLKVRILKREVVKPTSEYARPTLKVTGVIQQEGEFPVAAYRLSVALVAKAGTTKVGSCYINATVEERSAAFSEEIYLSEAAGKSPTANAIKIEMEDFGWYPKRTGKEKVTLEISK